MKLESAEGNDYFTTHCGVSPLLVGSSHAGTLLRVTDVGVEALVGYLGEIAIDDFVGLGDFIFGEDSCEKGVGRG